MDVHISVLPRDVLHTLALQLNHLSESDNASATLKFLRLPHPRTGMPSLFLPHRTAETDFILEVQTVSPHAGRSWFLSEGEVIADGKLVMMTRLDPIFLLIPILEAALSQGGSAGNFRTCEDIFEIASTKLAKTWEANADPEDRSTQLSPNDVLQLGELPSIQAAMRRLCDIQEIASDLMVHRYSRVKLLDYLVRKVKRLGQSGTVDASRTLVRELAKDGLMDDGKEVLLSTGRLKLACDMVSQYLPTQIYEELLAKFDFAALNAHAEALRSESLTIQESQSIKKLQESEAEGKKRKATSQSSKGVEKLKKANVKGMAKLSSFFQKAETKA